MAEELKIMQKVFDMMQYGYGALAQYPKSEKFALCTDIKRCMDTMLERTIEAQKKYYKKTTLQDLDVEVAKLRAYLRLSHELGFLPMKKYEVWSGMAVEIGKMLGGWLKTIKSQPKTYAAGEIDLDYALSVITSYRGLFKDVTSDAFLEKMLDEFVLSRPALEA